MPFPHAAPGAARRFAARAAASALPLALLLATACGPGLRPMARPTPGAAPAAAASRPAPPPPASADAEYLRDRQLMVPVAGVDPSRLRDDFDAKRSGNRTHRALDILAPRGTPVLATDDGRVLRVSRNTLGGLTVYMIDAYERFVYYYAHLDRYRDGLHAGEPVSRGDVLGYVGTTGNAPANVPHLHFQAMRYRRDRYWDGEAVNPKPYLVAPGLPVHAVTSSQEP